MVTYFEAIHVDCPSGYIVFVSREVIHMDCPCGYSLCFLWTVLVGIVFVSREVIHVDCPGGYNYILCFT